MFHHDEYPADGGRKALLAKYQVDAIIGKGSFATVYKGFLPVKTRDGKNTRQVIAIKEIDQSRLSDQLKKSIRSEIETMKQTEHVHIVRLIHSINDPTFIHIFTEYCDLSDLSRLIKNDYGDLSKEPQFRAITNMLSVYPRAAPVEIRSKSGRTSTSSGLNEVVCRHFAKQIFAALAYLHDMDIVHRDIKPQNILLTTAPAWRVQPRHIDDRRLIDLDAADPGGRPTVGLSWMPMAKVADFGFARELRSMAMASTLCGSPLYMAPEILKHERYDAKADLWSVGTVLYEMIVGRTPYTASNPISLSRVIERAQDPPRFPEVRAEPDMKDLLCRLLRRRPADRITFEDAFSHPVLTKPIPGLADEDRYLEEGYTKRPPASPSGHSGSSEGELVKSPERPVDGSIERTDRRTTERASERISEKSADQTAEKTAAPSRVPLKDPRKALLQHPSHPKSTLSRDGQAPDMASSIADYVVVETTNAIQAQRLVDELDQLRLRTSRGRSGLAAPSAPQTTPGVVNAADATSTPRSGRSRTRPVPTSLAAPGGVDGPSLPSSPAPPATSTAVVPRARSYERPYAPAPKSATSILYRALSMAGSRLSLMGLSPPNPAAQAAANVGGVSLRPNAVPTIPNGLGPIAVGPPPVDSPNSDARMVLFVEDIVSRSDVIYQFAEIKVRQLSPDRPRNESNGRTDPTCDLTVGAVITVAAEALVLFRKVLMMLNRAIRTAAEWASRRRPKAIEHEDGETIVDVASPPVVEIKHLRRMHATVQRARKRLGECLVQFDTVGRWLIDAQALLPVGHPSRPIRRHRSDTDEPVSAEKVADLIVLNTGVTAEYLLYLRADEISRSAAMSEFLNDRRNNVEPELRYREAIALMEAVLDDYAPVVGDGSSKAAAAAAAAVAATALTPGGMDSGAVTAGFEPIPGLDGINRAMVIRLIESMRGQLRGVRARLRETSDGR